MKSKSIFVGSIFLGSKFVVRALSVLIIASAFMAGCSDDKTPPDDGGDGKSSESSAKLGQKSGLSVCEASPEAFHQCALSILNGIWLSSADRAALSSCNLLSAMPQAASADEFEAARSAVLSQCEASSAL